MFALKPYSLYGSLLGPVLTDITMIKLERTIDKEMAHKSSIQLYMRYVDNTLLLVKDKDIIVHTNV